MKERLKKLAIGGAALVGLGEMCIRDSTLIVATVTTRIHKKANMPTHFVIYDNPAFKEASVVQLERCV